jgi:outer membrane receptor for ferric coprogen and ferric-rhodotorulic acid
MAVKQDLPKLKPIAAAVHAAIVGLTFAAGAPAQYAHAQSEPGAESSKKNYRIPSGSLGPALSRFAAEAGVLLSFDQALTEGKTTQGLSGDYSIGEALAALLAGSGLEAVKSASGYTLRAESSVRREEETQLDTVTVKAQAIDFYDLPPDEGFKADFQSSATKTPLPIRETPQSISVITQDSLEARQVQDLGQALETAAGVNQFSGTGPFAGKSPFGFDEITIRGIALDGPFDTRDDGFVSATLFSKPDVAIYERIEVVKGPSSTLYGRGSLGGFVNRMRKKPLTEFHSEIAPSIGSFDSYRLDADVTGPPFAGARGRLVAAYEDASAFVDGVESERVVAAPSLEFDLTDTTRLLVQGLYQEDRFIPNPFPCSRTVASSGRPTFGGRCSLACRTRMRPNGRY